MAKSKRQRSQDIAPAEPTIGDGAVVAGDHVVSQVADGDPQRVISSTILNVAAASTPAAVFQRSATEAIAIPFGQTSLCQNNLRATSGKRIAGRKAGAQAPSIAARFVISTGIGPGTHSRPQFLLASQLISALDGTVQGFVGVWVAVDGLWIIGRSARRRDDRLSRANDGPEPCEAPCPSPQAIDEVTRRNSAPRCLAVGSVRAARRRNITASV